MRAYAHPRPSARWNRWHAWRELARLTSSELRSEHGPRPSELRAVLVALISRASWEGDCWLSQTDLGEAAGCSASTVRKCLARLAELGVGTYHPRGFCGRYTATFRLELGRADEVIADRPSQVIAKDAPDAITAKRTSRAAQEAKAGKSVILADNDGSGQTFILRRAYVEARAERWGLRAASAIELGTPETWSRLARFCSELAAELGVSFAAAAELAMRAYCRQRGFDGRLSELHHPIAWWPRYATAIERDVRRQIRSSARGDVTRGEGPSVTAAEFKRGWDALCRVVRSAPS